ncbi:MAG: HD domain-containing protein [Halanaerobiales bacterium]|nr:HD domain-containing protein [Halanaerobiales bacterium]
MKNKYQELKEWFDLYTKEFAMQNKKDQKNINLKINHSRRVTKDMEEIIKGFTMSEEEKYLARIIALYHDIGRFKQYKEYQTFSDYKSEDHGRLGVEVIRENKLIDDLSQDYQKVIYKAIEQHNKAEIDKDYFENEKEIFFAELIRDADKLDIFNIFVNRYQDGSQKDFIIKLSTEAKITDEVYKKILKKEPINYDKLETLNDLKMMQLTWIYDINFAETIEIIKERRYLEIIYNSMENNEKADHVYNEIKNYIS